MSEYIINSEDYVLGMATIPYLREKIVRCRDCKYHHDGMCMLTDGMGDFKRWFVDDDDYCSDGEKVGA